jgi:hypothetical protein
LNAHCAKSLRSGGPKACPVPAPGRPDLDGDLNRVLGRSLVLVPILGPPVGGGRRIRVHNEMPKGAPPLEIGAGAGSGFGIMSRVQIVGLELDLVPGAELGPEGVPPFWQEFSTPGCPSPEGGGGTRPEGLCRGTGTGRRDVGFTTGPLGASDGKRSARRPRRACSKQDRVALDAATSSGAAAAIGAAASNSSGAPAGPVNPK